MYTCTYMYSTILPFLFCFIDLFINKVYVHVCGFLLSHIIHVHVFFYFSFLFHFVHCFLFSLLIIFLLLFLFLSSRQTSDGNTVLLVDLNINNNNQSIIDEIFQFIGTKPEEAVSELYIHVHVHVHTNLWEEGLEYKHTKHLIQAYYTKHSNISTPSLISACFFTVGIQAHTLINIRDFNNYYSSHMIVT